MKDGEYICYSYNINFPNKVFKILITDVSNDNGINNNNITCFAVRQATITNIGFKVNSKTLLNKDGSNSDALNLMVIGN